MWHVRQRFNEPHYETYSGPNLLAQYLRLRDQGWKTLWTGEGKMCRFEAAHEQWVAVEGS
jgi:hypothetical protein